MSIEYNEIKSNEVKSMSEQMSLETYKQKVKECLMKNGNSTYAEERIKLYENEFPQFLKDKWTPGGVAAALIMGY